MQIDWFTLGAQVFNFVLLAVLLWYVLYRPIRRAVDQREEEIQSRVEQARQEKEEAQELKEEHRQKKAEIEAERDSILQEAREEAEERRKERLEEIRKEMEKVEEEWKESLRRDREAFLEELAGRIREEAFEVIRRGLEDLAQTQPPEAVRKAFLRKARDLPEEERTSFVEALVNAGGTCRLRSSFQMEEEDTEPIRKLVEEWMKGDEGEGSVAMEMEVDDEGPRGIELWAGDRKMAWSVDAYVEQFQAEVEGILESETDER